MDKNLWLSIQDVAMCAVALAVLVWLLWRPLSPKLRGLWEKRR